MLSIILSENLIWHAGIDYIRSRKLLPLSYTIKFCTENYHQQLIENIFLSWRFQILQIIGKKAS